MTDFSARALEMSDITDSGRGDDMVFEPVNDSPGVGLRRPSAYFKGRRR